jgi:hypothetical protein
MVVGRRDQDPPGHNPLLVAGMLHRQTRPASEDLGQRASFACRKMADDKDGRRQTRRKIPDDLPQSGDARRRRSYDDDIVSNNPTSSLCSHLESL